MRAKFVELKGKVDTAQARMTEAKQAVARADQRVVAASKEVKLAEQDYNKTMREQPTLESQDMDNTDEEMMVLTLQLEETQQEVTEMRVQLEDLRSSKADTKSRQAAAQKRLDQHNAVYERMADRSLNDETYRLVEEQRAVDESLALLAEQQQKLEDKITSCEQACQQSKDELTRTQTLFDGPEGSIEEAAAQAVAALRHQVEDDFDHLLPPSKRLRETVLSTDERKAAYVGSKLTQQALHQRLTSLQKKLTEAERAVSQTDRDELTRKQRHLDRQALMMDRQLKRNEHIFGLLVNGHKDREAKLDRTKKEIMDLANAKFRAYLERRNQLGYINVDFDTEELRLSIKKKNDPNAVAVTDLRQLSGGERSYVMVSFLLAVGSQTELPFCCLDEYDIFMDSISRRTATQTLLEFAMTDFPERQFILLTPQDIAAVEAAKESVQKNKKVHLPQHFLRIVQMPVVARGRGEQRPEGA